MLLRTASAPTDSVALRWARFADVAVAEPAQAAHVRGAIGDRFQDGPGQVGHGVHVVVGQRGEQPGDGGATLYYPSTPRQPMRPTRRGTALLQALSRPDIQALARAQAPCPSTDSHPRRPPMAPSPHANLPDSLWPV
jgi:hypothetical protein